jgi:hypothetical protein
MSTYNDFTILTPCYNEQGTIGSLLGRLNILILEFTEQIELCLRNGHNDMNLLFLKKNFKSLST